MAPRINPPGFALRGPPGRRYSDPFGQTILEMLQRDSEREYLASMELAKQAGEGWRTAGNILGSAYPAYQDLQARRLAEEDRQRIISAQEEAARLAGEDRAAKLRRDIYDLDKERLGALEGQPGQTIAELIGEPYRRPETGAPGQRLYLPDMPRLGVPTFEDAVGEGPRQLTPDQAMPVGIPQSQIAMIQSPITGQPDLPVPLKTAEMAAHEKYETLQDEIDAEARQEALERGTIRFRAGLEAEATQAEHGNTLARLGVQHGFDVSMAEQAAAHAMNLAGFNADQSLLRAQQGFFKIDKGLPHPDPNIEGTVFALYSKAPGPDGNPVIVYPPGRDGQPILLPVEEDVSEWFSGIHPETGEQIRYRMEDGTPVIEPIKGVTSAQVYGDKSGEQATGMFLSDEQKQQLINQSTLAQPIVDSEGRSWPEIMRAPTGFIQKFGQTGPGSNQLKWINQFLGTQEEGQRARERVNIAVIDLVKILEDQGRHSQSQRDWIQANMGNIRGDWDIAKPTLYVRFQELRELVDSIVRNNFLSLTSGDSVSEINDRKEWMMLKGASDRVMSAFGFPLIQLLDTPREELTDEELRTMEPDGLPG